ncbi:uncharacterized protein BP5553_06402 [Venustampulla echinocandica]|uniref:Triosephosphate isomerase n=1 Tax=Venustampulla echinocandica TaxID=2656787 RepID=A0A370TJT4_9HELO|nr:uncharacterized protein BP5553_06402 [Venustampulla echinocandica]RDL35790.1 hypothetical protein BP5553_06402 [Venustampulla echinocandica]
MSTSSPALPRPKRTIGISLKLYFDHPKTVSYLAALQPLNALAQSHDISLFLIPSMISLPLLLAQQSTASSNPTSSPQILLGAQNSFYEDDGAYTGEVSPLGLAQLGCSLVELGHAERRRLFGEDDAVVALKARASLRNGMVPLVCIGEKHEGSVEEAVAECRSQVESILDVLDESEKTNKGARKEIIFAYEPVWAIGQPTPAPAEYVVNVVKALRDICVQRGRGGHGEIRFLYGGSAGPGTFEKMSEGVDGLFLGRFGHDPKRVREVIEEVARA